MRGAKGASRSRERPWICTSPGPSALARFPEVRASKFPQTQRRSPWLEGLDHTSAPLLTAAVLRHPAQIPSGGSNDASSAETGILSPTEYSHVLIFFMNICTLLGTDFIPFGDYLLSTYYVLGTAPGPLTPRGQGALGRVRAHCFSAPVLPLEGSGSTSQGAWRSWGVKSVSRMPARLEDSVASNVSGIKEKCPLVPRSSHKI